MWYTVSNCNRGGKIMKILVLNGPNLNLLGVREPTLYGKADYRTLCTTIRRHAKEAGVTVRIRQSNSEGQLVTWIQQAAGHFDGIILNAAAYTHTSVAILDALKAVALPTVEVHLTDIAAREDFRRHSYVALYTPLCIKGHGIQGYVEAIDLLCKTVNK